MPSRRVPQVPTAAMWAVVGTLVGLGPTVVVAGAGPAAISLAFDAATALHTVADKYVSFNIDTGSLYNGMDFGDPLLRCVAPLAEGTCDWCASEQQEVLARQLVPRSACACDRDGPSKSRPACALRRGPLAL
jgi:hypothetical protein